jgi:RimJ/RimL family protein N-acetyltransferase
MNLEVCHYEGLNHTPAVALAQQGWAESIKDGLSEPIVALGWDQNAIVASIEDGTPVGVLVWAKQDWGKQIVVVFGYVLPEFRRKGVYDKLWLALVDKAKELKITRILGETHIDNQAMRAVAKKHGRHERSVMLTFDVPSPPIDERPPCA